MVVVARGNGTAEPPHAAPPRPATPLLGPAADYTGFGGEIAVTLSGYTGEAMEPFLSKDGTTLFFNSSNDPTVDTDLYRAKRLGGLNFKVEGRVAGANGPTLDAVASLDAAGNFYFVSDRSYAGSLSTLYRGRYAEGSVSRVALVAGVSRHQPGLVNFDAEVSHDGRTLYFDDGRYEGGKLVATTLVVAARTMTGAFLRRSDSAALLASVNATGLNYAPSISADGLELFFTRSDPAVANGVPSLYRVARATAELPFGRVQHVAAATGFAEGATLSTDGRSLYYHRQTPAGFRLFRITR